MLKQKEIQAQVKATKTQLTKYHTLVFPESKPQYEKLITVEKLKSQKTAFAKLQKQVDLEAESQTNKLVTELRASGLIIKPEDRQAWINQIVQNDLFSLEKNEDIQLNLLTSASSATLGSSLAVYSMISSTIQGSAYLFKSEKFPVELSKLVKRLEHNSVAQRFCIAVLQKLSYLEKPCSVYHKQGLIEWSLEYFENSKKKPIHSFNSIYLMSLLYNMLSSEVIILEMGKNLREFGVYLNRLLRLLEVELPVQCYSIILNILISQRKFNVKYEDLQLEGKLSDTARNTLEKFEELFKGINIRLILQIIEFLSTQKIKFLNFQKLQQRIKKYRRRRNQMIELKYLLRIASNFLEGTIIQRVKLKEKVLFLNRSKMRLNILEESYNLQKLLKIKLKLKKSV